MALPVAAIVCIVLAGWVVLVLAFFGLYQYLKQRGKCNCDCAPCGTEGGESCSCCKSASDACSCRKPSLDGCLNSLCPKKKVSCVDIILCQCCAEPGQDSCFVNIFPCCTRDCACCDDGCCTCCADCEALVCCCLEIRLVSNNSLAGTSPTSAKYTLNTHQNITHNQNNTVQPKQTAAADVIVKNVIKMTKPSNRTPSSARKSSSKSNQSTTGIPSTARSVSQLQLSYASSHSQQQTTRKPTTKLKSAKGTRQESDTKSISKSNTARKRSLPFLPALPLITPTSKDTNVRTGARKRTSSGPFAGELKEVPVKQHNVILHSQLYDTHSQASGSVHNGLDLILGLPQHYDAMSRTVSLDADYSSVPLSPGTVLDGSVTHRSSSAGSNLNVRFDMQGQNSDFVSFTSPRPLPGPPVR